MPLNTAGLNALPKQLGTHGSAVNNTVRQIAGAIGTAVVITIYTSQATNHAAEIMREKAAAAPQQIASLSSIQGSSDAYYFMMILAVAALVLTLFMPGKSAAGKKETASSSKMAEES